MRDSGGERKDGEIRSEKGRRERNEREREGEERDILKGKFLRWRNSLATIGVLIDIFSVWI